MPAFQRGRQGAGFADERHLWPAFAWLIEQCRPAVVFGEQVASKDADAWIDLVQADLEAMEYAVGAVPFPSAGIGAPHIRDRLYWVADNAGGRWREECSDTGGLAARDRAKGITAGSEYGGVPGGMGNANGWNTGAERKQHGRKLRLHSEDRSDLRATDQRARTGVARDCSAAGPVNGLWAAADWIFCRDGRWRPVEPGTFPLAHGAASRVGRLRAYGNAINAQAAQIFVESYLNN